MSDGLSEIALEEFGMLIAACEAEFIGDGPNDWGDDEEVASPSSHITFGMIRRARIAYDRLSPGVDSSNIDGYDEGLPE